MERKRRIEITLEREETFVVCKLATGAARSWCAGCAAEVEMLTPEEAALIAGVSARTIYRRIEADLLHFAETIDGLLLVCQKSLMDRLAADPRRLTTGGI